ncbi:peptide chain release factor 1 [Neofamilia massiliensis]|uniref:peptide chain release factor 1 n=1 Tax=Neofamilia massiliensis TaxID=1673724 RepID=UPI0006BB5E6B|nr:peptide chain release factor 1 [Neofamilia massiliensis]
MYENLQVFEDRFVELEKSMIDPEVLADSRKLQETAKEHADLKDIVEKYREYKNLTENLEETKLMFDDKLDPEMREMVNEEVRNLEKSIEEVEEEIKILLVPKDENDDKNVIIEIRAGAGGDEAALFAGVLFRMYTMYAESHRWKVDLMNTNEIGIGGYKEVIFMVNGHGAYSKLKYESGVHRVQRVPETESSGRIHTSTVTVAVLPEAEEVEIEINPQDVRVDVFRSSGNGGQSVNTTDSAVRLTHIPTGIVISCQDEKSQLKNKDKAMKILKAKLYEQMQAEQAKELSDEKRSQVGTGDRSERIRTYNYPQGRITDHRINKTIHQIDNFLDGDLDEMIDELTAFDQTQKMEMMA